MPVGVSVSILSPALVVFHVFDLKVLPLPDAEKAFLDLT